MTISSVMDDMPARLTAAAEHVLSAKEALRIARLHRNMIVVEAVDGGMYQHDVAKYAGVQQPQVTRILARPYDDDVDAAA